MGGHLVSLAFKSKESLAVGANARLVLLMMAGVALDNPVRGRPARWFYGSRFSLSKALGFDVRTPGEDPEGDELRDRAKLAVRRAIAPLVKTGAIAPRSLVDPAHRVHTGRQEEYFVLVGLSPAERLDYLSQWRPVDNSDGDTEHWTENAPLSGHRLHPSLTTGVHFVGATGGQFLHPQGTTSKETLNHDQSEDSGVFARPDRTLRDAS